MILIFGNHFFENSSLYFGNLIHTSFQDFHLLGLNLIFAKSYLFDPLIKAGPSSAVTLFFLPIKLWSFTIKILPIDGFYHILLLFVHFTILSIISSQSLPEDFFEEFIYYVWAKHLKLTTPRCATRLRRRVLIIVNGVNFSMISFYFELGF